MMLSFALPPRPFLQFPLILVLLLALAPAVVDPAPVVEDRAHVGQEGRAAAARVDQAVVVQGQAVAQGTGGKFRNLL